MIVPHAGIAPDARHSLRRIASCSRASPCGKPPRHGPFPAARFRHGGRIKARRDAHPAGGAFLHRSPGLAVWQRLVLGIPLVCTAGGAWGRRRVCLLVHLTGLDRLVAASSGAQPQVNRQVEDAIVTDRREESAR